MKFYKKIFCFFLILVCSLGSAQNTLDNIGLTSATAAAGAYSLRKLSSSYLGNAIQVRRSSDNTTQNIGFTIDGDLDTNSLTSFVGSGDGFVSIWYDQSGNNNNAVQNTLLNQPKIIVGGVIERANGLPTIIFSGSQFLVITSIIFNNDLTGCLVYKASSSSASSGTANTWYRMNGIFGSEQPGGTTDFSYGIYNNKFTAGNGPSDNSVAGTVNVNDNITRQQSWSRNKTTGQIILYSNSSSDSNAYLNAGTSSSVPSVAIGANQTFSGGQVFFNGNVSELVLFAAVLANPRQTIENNQGLYYSICLLANQPSSNNQSVVLGGSPTSLSVFSNNPTATYQWYSNTIKSNTGGTILSGETNSNYTPSTTEEGTLYYYAVISTATTSCASNVSGYVRVGIEITSQPSTSNQTVIQNNSVNTLNVVATGSNITYQWYKNLNKTNTGGTLINGATNNSYTPQSTDLGTNYYYVVISGNNTVLVSNPSGAIKITRNPVIWSGSIITFSKANYADYTLVQNQDVLTNTVKITRANEQGLFNIATESGFGGSSPSNTEWAEGLLSNYANLTYSTWQQAVNYSAAYSVNKTYVVHLIAENIFLELKILSWTNSGNGGGFSYSRTTPPPCIAPSEPTASNQSFNSPATVADLVATGTNIKWYLANTGGSSLQTNTTLTSGTYYVTQTVNSCESARKAVLVTIISCLAPTLSNFNAVNKTYFDSNYTVSPPTSNSSGVFTYTSSNLSVATISGTTINIIAAGNTTITANQAADGTYCNASITSNLTVNNVSVLTKNGQISTSNFNYINKNGALATSSSLTANGKIIAAKSNDGLSAASAGTSALQIKMDFPNATDGLYWIKNSNINGGTPFQIYADMTTDGGGWTLIMKNSNSTGWNYSNAISLNTNIPFTNIADAESISTPNYSIIGWADYIKKSTSGFQYMIDAGTRRSYGGIWTANGNYSFIKTDNSQTNITLNTKFGNWNYVNDDGISERMPWYQNDCGTITTDNGGGNWWGTLISTCNGWNPTPWISNGGGGATNENPNIIWYWVR